MKSRKNAPMISKTMQTSPLDFQHPDCGFLPIGMYNKYGDIMRGSRRDLYGVLVLCGEFSLVL